MRDVWGKGKTGNNEVMNDNLPDEEGRKEGRGSREKTIDSFSV